MKHLCTFALLIALAACSAVQGDTPLQRYYGLQQDYRAAQTAATLARTAGLRPPTARIVSGSGAPVTVGPTGF